MTKEPLTTFAFEALVRDIETTTEQKREIWTKTIEAIVADNGAQYDQKSWSNDSVVSGHCGTQACIAGHVVHETVALGILPPFMRGTGYEMTCPARMILRLTGSFVNQIFWNIAVGDLSVRPQLVSFLEKCRDHCDQPDELERMAEEFADAPSIWPVTTTLLPPPGHNPNPGKWRCEGCGTWWDASQRLTGEDAKDSECPDCL